MPIKFLKDYRVKAPGGAAYHEGQEVKDLPPSSELHFVSRGAAGYIDQEGKLTDVDGREIKVEKVELEIVTVSANRDGGVGRAGEVELEDGTPQRGSPGPGPILTASLVGDGEQKLTVKKTVTKPS